MYWIEINFFIVMQNIWIINNIIFYIYEFDSNRRAIFEADVYILVINFVQYQFI